MLNSIQNKRILLFSGGLDSLIAWRLLNMPDCLYFAIGHKYQEAELASIHRLQNFIETNFNEKLNVIISNRLQIGDLEEVDGHIPYRNELFVSVAAAAGYNKIYIGALAGETSRDKSWRFLNDTSKYLSFLEQRQIEILAPFKRMTKTDLVKKYLINYSTDLDRQLLLQTTSCYNANANDLNFRCGQCMSCFRRWVALENNGLTEEYKFNPAEWEQAKIESWKSWIKYIRRTNIEDLWGLIKNNIDAYKALSRRIQCR